MSGGVDCHVLYSQEADKSDVQREKDETSVQREAKVRKYAAERGVRRLRLGS